MNRLWTKAVGAMAMAMAFGALADAGTPTRPRSASVVTPARGRTMAGVGDDTDIAHVARPNALNARLTPIRDGTSNTIIPRRASFTDGQSNTLVDGTSNTLKAQARPSGLHDDTVGAGIVRPSGVREGTVFHPGGWGSSSIIE